MATVTAETARWSEVPDRDDQSAMPDPTAPGAGCVFATLSALSLPVVLLLFRVTEWVVL
ncbi:hypothetical protein [Amycolatopsis palatopharyngis]|uniref:hypothetical protein n=1 Tax=Amycolatopsis palatopharyngis TaxID=187982 RepID=UPI0013BE93FE|nr:hypothetical protein [Amycolatopsis palatopharyngis]